MVDESSGHRRAAIGGVKYVQAQRGLGDGDVPPQCMGDLAGRVCSDRAGRSGECGASDCEYGLRCA